MTDHTLKDYYSDLRSWTRNLQKSLDDASIRDNATDEAYQKALADLEESFVSFEDNESFTYENVMRLSKEAKELYEEFLQPDQDVRKDGNKKRVEIGEHRLPPLPYSYNALEPYIAEEIMKLHHTEHHQSYVDGLNKAEKEMKKARENNDFDLIKHWEREAAFNGAGHYLHSIFWKAMSPKGGGRPKGELAEQINKDFGSFKQFKEHFSEAAKNVEAVGWAILVWSPQARRLEILQAEKHQNLSQWDVVPLLPLDVWEHAYYLQYKNKRKLYVDNWWNVVNWDRINCCFKEAKKPQYN